MSVTVETSQSAMHYLVKINAPVFVEAVIAIARLPQSGDTKIELVLAYPWSVGDKVNPILSKIPRPNSNDYARLGNMLTKLHCSVAGAKSALDTLAKMTYLFGNVQEKWLAGAIAFIDK